MRCLAIMIYVLLSNVNFSQVDTLFDIHYHQKGSISTKSVIFSEEVKWGYAKAFNTDGKEIYSMGTRRFGGHASVEFSYYDNGAVRIAHYSSHPDGGIQWGDITHYFDQQGNVTSIIDNSSDMYGHPQLHLTEEPVIERQEPELERKDVVIKQETIPCAEIFETAVYVVNLSEKAISTSAFLDNNIVPIKIEKKDTSLINYYIEAQIFTHPKDKSEVYFYDKKRKKTIQLNSFWAEPFQPTRTKRTYYLIVY